MEFLGTAVDLREETGKYRRKGYLVVKVEGYRNYRILELPGSIAQRLVYTEDDEQRRVLIRAKRKKRRYSRNEFELYRLYKGQRIKVRPPFQKEFIVNRLGPLSNKPIYSYKLIAKEATEEWEFERIAELEQYHYASEKEVVAVWRCDKCGTFIRSNVKPVCPKCGTDEYVHIAEIRSSTPASRFLVLHLADRKPREPDIVGYVRVDPPIPLMHRRLPDGKIERNIRLKVFPKERFEKVFWPEKELKELYSKLKKQNGYLARYKLWQEARKRAISESDSGASRIARVVIHPEYRSDGLGQAAVRAALERIKERHIPEMRREKHLVETIAMMARYNPFFEKVGFKYLWDTASGRPVLYYPLTEEGKKYIEKFLSTDPIAKQHQGRLWRPKFGKVETLSEPIRLVELTKKYTSELSLDELSEKVRVVLQSFGVHHRRVEKYVLHKVNLSIEPGEVVAVIGSSGAGKTTLLRMIIGAIEGMQSDLYQPDMGEVIVPKNAKLQAFIPGELEPKFGNDAILETIYRITGDESLAVEVLNISGISDAVLYRAKFHQLSTGQKERAKIAYLLAHRPNVLIIDEFAAHLDVPTAMRLARKVSSVARKSGMTLIVSTHRPAVVNALEPDSVIYVGFGVVEKLPWEDAKKRIIGSRGDLLWKKLMS